MAVALLLLAEQFSHAH